MAFGKGSDRFPEREPREPLPPPPVEEGGSYYGGPPANSPPEEFVANPTQPPPLEPPLAGGPADVQDVTPLPPDLIGDIPPPPAPTAPEIPLPPPIAGVGVGGVPGSEGSTFARPGSQGAAAFRTPAFTPRPRFGPGAPMVGGGAAAPTGLGDAPLDPERAAELLRSLAGGQ